MIDELILQIVENPTEENKEQYNKLVNQNEYQLLLDSQNFTPKSQEWFDKRKEAFSYRRKCALMLISSWVKKYGTTKGCVVSYVDTLIIPFQTIKQPTY